MKLSIVIPIFGVEKYIEKCLMSCINQRLLLGSDYEIICVNDGTKDRSAIIAKEIAKSYNGVTVLDQENGGLSKARNTGLAHAQGEYIWFVDSDDWITDDCINTINESLNCNLDMLQIQYQLCYENGDIKPAIPCCIDGIVSGIYQTVKGGLDTPAQFTIYRKNFLVENQFKFKVGIYHEDAEFKPRVLLKAQRVASIPNVCYNYLQRTSGSITSIYKLRNATDMLVVLNSLYEYVSSYDKRIKQAIYTKIGLWMNDILLGIRRLEKEEYEIALCKLKTNKHLFKAMIGSNKIIYRIEGLLLCFNIKFALSLHKLFR